MTDINTIAIYYMTCLCQMLVFGQLQTDTISYLEPVDYDPQSLHHQHRTRRSTGEYVYLKFNAFTRHWSLKLDRNNRIFHQDLVIENSKGPLTYDVHSAYTGEVVGEHSRLFGTITTNGHFEGQIQIHNSTFILERASRHNLSDLNIHSVMYNVEDVKIPKNTHFCGMENNHEHTLKPKIPGINSEEDFKLRYTSRETDTHRRYRRAINPVKKICELYMQVDHTLFFKFSNNTDDMITHITNHVMMANTIFNQIDFDDDTNADGIGFSIKRIKIHDDPTVSGYKYTEPNLGVVSLLNKHSEENYDSFCLSYIFTYRDFENGILGLAWTAEPSTAGGLCSRYQSYSDGSLSLNAGVVTFLNYGHDVTTAVSYVTFAHEIGHNFGSLHDSTSNPTCAPGEPDGNYIMFAQATSGTKPNNNKFSSCSITQMAAMIDSRGRETSSGCFVETSDATCGNSVVETGEDCDCGWDDDCTDTCCYPSLSDTSHPDANKACQFKSGVTCSPSQGQCCSPSTCVPYTVGENIECRSNTSCLERSYCTGGLTCPQSTAMSNGTVCADEQVCYLGQCSGQVCLANGYQPCQCEATTSGNWKDELLCTLCCLDHNDGETCKTADQLFSLPFTKAVPGSPCNNFLGYCDVFHICREVDPEGSLFILKDFLLNGGLVDKVKQFLTEYWYVGVAGGVGLIIILALFLKCCSKSTKGKVEPEPKRVSVAESRTRY